MVARINTNMIKKTTAMMRMKTTYMEHNADMIDVI